MGRPVTVSLPPAAGETPRVGAGAERTGDRSGPERLPAWVAAVVLAGLVATITAVAVWGSRTGGARFTIRVPEGTAAAVQRGEDPGLVDEVLVLRVGDRVALVNDDTVLHQLGPLAAGPGERTRMTFEDQVRIDGSTTLRPSGTVTIVVRPRNAPDPTTTTRR